MNTELTVITNQVSPILPVAWQGDKDSGPWAQLTTAEKDAAKDNRSRLAKYDAYLADVGLAWHKVDLAAYRDALKEQGLAASTIGAHLSTVRARYDALLRDREVRAQLYTLAGAQLAAIGQDANPANRAAIVQELIAQIENAINPKAAPVKGVQKQDEKLDDQVRLSRSDASKLIASPGLNSTIAIRDTAIIALALCTGLREQELCDLDVRDLRQHTLDGALALEVRKGKGKKQRLVPYGALDTCLAFVDAWLAHAGISSGAMFRGVLKSGEIRQTRLTTRSIRKILARYPIVVAGKLTRVAPHDLRRTYAARLYNNGKGLPVEAIQQNLGHARRETTMRYIGVLSSEARQPGAVYDFDLAGLDNVPAQQELELE